MTDTTPMPFGKHKGKPLEEVPAKYLLWLYEQDNFPTNYPELAKYIVLNMKGLEQEAEEES